MDSTSSQSQSSYLSSVLEGIYPVITEAKLEYWSSFAPLPVENVIAAGPKAKEDSPSEFLDFHYFTNSSALDYMYKLNFSSLYAHKLRTLCFIGLLILFLSF